MSELRFALQDLHRLLLPIEKKFYNPAPDHVQGSTSDTPMVQSGNRHHTKPPCHLGQMDTLFLADSILLHPDIPPMVSTQYPDPHPDIWGAFCSMYRTIRLQHLMDWVDQGWEPGLEWQGLVLDCWVQVRQELGLTYSGQPSLHEPMTLAEMAELLGVPDHLLVGYARQGKLERWTVAGLDLYRVPTIAV